MTRVILFFFLFTAVDAQAQVYLGDGGGTGGKGGSCCTWTAIANASGVCDAGSLVSHPTCQIITKAQFDAFIATFASNIKQFTSVTVSNGTPTLNSCAGGALNSGSTDGQGSISFTGVSIATSCGLTFGSPPYNGAGCKVDLTGTTGRGITTTTTGFTVSLQGAIPNGKITYFCPQ